MGHYVHHLDIASDSNCHYVPDRCGAGPAGQSAARSVPAPSKTPQGRCQHDQETVQGILNGQARQHLGQLVFYVFVPSLTFTKLASSVDLHNLAVWWPLPVNTALR